MMKNLINAILTEGTIKIKLEVYNPIARYLCYKRGKKLTKYWNDNLPLMQKDVDINKMKDEHYYFKWNTLVTQELRMYNIIGKKVYEDDLLTLCKTRRGLSEIQINFIRDGLKLIKLYGE